MNAATETAKPRILPLADGAFRVTFPNGRTATLLQAHGGMVGWSVQGEDGLAGEAWGFAHALRAAWTSCASAPEATKLSAAEVQVLADAAEGCTAAATKALKKVLKLRTGFAWSVRSGRGTSGSWITISSLGSRQVNGTMSTRDAVTLSTILGESAHDSHSIRPCGGVRAECIWKIAGLPVPSTLRVNAPTWD